MKQVFESSRIAYVEVEERLIQDYLRMVNDAEHVGRLIGLKAPVSEEDERQWVRRKLAEKPRSFP